MPRPKHCRRVSGDPACRKFKPAGTAARDLEETVLALEELEALRLADMEGLYQEAAAQCMGVSRATFGRILQEGRAKVATALVRGMVIRIEGGDYEMNQDDKNTCCGMGMRNRQDAAGGDGRRCNGQGGRRRRNGSCRQPEQARAGAQGNGREEEN